MENNSIHTENEEFWKREEKSHTRGKIFGGFLIATAGSLFLAKELGAEIPHWVFTWKMFLITLGLMIGVKHNFRHAGWFFIMLTGVTFLLGDIYPEMNIKSFVWPVLIILLGLAIMFKPKRQRRHHKWAKMHGQFHRRRYNKNGPFECSTGGIETDSSEDVIDSTTFMAAIKKNVLSKNFKGGDITNIFGGTELNLTQADFEQSATLDLTNIFGGTKLLIPANWEISSDLTSVFGNIEDKRAVEPNPTNEKRKTLILRGTTFMGGIEIKSY